jgi:hypothetical protein
MQKERLRVKCSRIASGEVPFLEGRKGKNIFRTKCRPLLQCIAVLIIVDKTNGRCDMCIG